MSHDKKLICIGIITSAHGIKGAVKIKSFTDNPADIARYTPLYGADGKVKYELKILSENGEMLIAEIKGVTTRNDSEMLNNTELFIYRDMLPPAKDNEFYYEDLIGLEARNAKDDTIIGRIVGVYNHGAGDIIELKLQNSDKTQLLNFSKEIVPEVNVAKGYLTIVLPKAEFIDEG